MSHQSQNQSQSQSQNKDLGQNTGAGSRQQEQATAGGSMEQDRQGDSQMEQQGGTYRPEGDRGVEFESDSGNDITMSGRQPEQHGERGSQQDLGRRDDQQEQSDLEKRRQAEQQDGASSSQPGENTPPGYGDR